MREKNSCWILHLIGSKQGHVLDLPTLELSSKSDILILSPPQHTSTNDKTKTMCMPAIIKDCGVCLSSNHAGYQENYRSIHKININPSSYLLRWHSQLPNLQGCREMRESRSVGRSAGYPNKPRCVRVRTMFSNAMIITTTDNFVMGSSLTISDVSSICEM